MEELLKKLTVVYVEDEEEVRKKITKALKRRLGEVFEASNGEEGLELICKHHPHIVLTDLEMPVLNGIEMIKQIREKAGKMDKCDIPIIVVTAYHDEEHFTDLANAYIFKPIILSKLVDTLVQIAKECKIFEKL